jgi:hypothetical protein
MERNRDASRPQVNLPPLRSVRRLWFRDTSDLEALGGEHFRQRAGKQYLVEPFAEVVWRAFDDVEVEVVRVTSTAKPCPEVYPAFDDPVCSVESSFEHPKQTQMKGLYVLDLRLHFLDNRLY